MSVSSQAETPYTLGSAFLLFFFFFLQMLTEPFHIQKLCAAARPGLGFLSVSNSTLQQTVPLKELCVGKRPCPRATHQLRGWFLLSSVCFCDSEWLVGGLRKPRTSCGGCQVCAILTLVTR